MRRLRRARVGASADNADTACGFTKGQLITPEEFGRIVLRTGADGAIVRIDDVARVELGSESYSSVSSF